MVAKPIHGSRASYDAAQENRSGDITRKDGVNPVRKFDGEWPSRFEKELMEYLSVDPRLGETTMNAFKEPRMTIESFIDMADQFRSPHLWSKTDGVWPLRHQVT